MKHVSILIPYGHTSLVNIEGTHQILNQVNGFLAEMQQAPLFKIHLVGLSKETRQTNGLFTINPDLLVKDVKKTDLIIIPAMHGDQKAALELNKEFIPWITNQYKGGAEVASFCIGSYFLAATGLLDGKQCATHWLHANDFRQMFPQVALVDDKIMTEEDGIYTSGGAYSYLNLLLYLIEKHTGREIAILTSKAFMIDIDKNSQSPFIMFQGQKTHEDDMIKKAQEYIENHYREKITVEELASMLAVGRRSLERRFKKATCNTVRSISSG
jgi:transcriptional regulator GlxA family with amidase domain